MISYLVKYYARAAITQTKNYIWVMLGLITAIAVGGYSVLAPLYRNAFLFQNYLFEAALICSTFMLVSLLFGHRPGIFFHPATIHFFVNTVRFRKIKAMALSKKAFVYAVFVLIFCLLLTDFKVSVSFIRLFISYLAFFLTAMLTKWFKYNGAKIYVWAGVFLLSAASLVMEAYYSSWYILTAQVLLSAALVLCYFRFRIDLSKYYDYALYTARINYASRYKDMAAAAQITADHVAQKNRTMKLSGFPLNRSTALFYKALTDNIRISKAVIVLLLGFYLFGILINRTTLFQNFPVIGEPSAARIIGALSVAVFVSNLREIYLKQIMSMLSKHEKGLFLPYRKEKVISCYALLCNVLVIVVAVLAGLLLQAAWIRIVIVSGMFLAAVNLSLWYAKGNRAVYMISNGIIIITAYLLF